MVLGRDVYGFLRCFNTPLGGVRNAVQQRLGIDLEEREGAYWGEYFFWDGGGDGVVRDVSVFENPQGPDAYGDYPGYSPLILVKCVRRDVADVVHQKLADILNLIVLRRFGARLRAFRGCEDSVSFDLVETDENLDLSEADESGLLVRTPVVLRFEDLMSVVALDPDDDLTGALELTPEHWDRLRRYADIAIVPGRRYWIDLYTVARLPWTLPLRR